jgi:hypothetical protein
MGVSLLRKPNLLNQLAVGVDRTFSKARVLKLCSRGVSAVWQLYGRSGSILQPGNSA